MVGPFTKNAPQTRIRNKENATICFNLRVERNAKTAFLTHALALTHILCANQLSKRSMPLNFQKEEGQMRKGILWAVVCLMVAVALIACGGGGSSSGSNNTTSCTKTSVNGSWNCQVSTGGGSSQWIISLTQNGSQMLYSDATATQTVSYTNNAFTVDFSDPGLDSEFGKFTVIDNCNISTRVTGTNLNNGNTWDYMGTCTHL